MFAACRTYRSAAYRLDDPCLDNIPSGKDMEDSVADAVDAEAEVPSVDASVVGASYVDGASAVGAFAVVAEIAVDSCAFAGDASSGGHHDAGLMEEEVVHEAGMFGLVGASAGIAAVRVGSAVLGPSLGSGLSARHCGL